MGRGAPAVGGAKPKLWGSANAQQKPLLPLTERKSHEEDLVGRRARKGSQDGDKFDIAPDGASAGREGRQFAVVNVGNHGRIYLKYAKLMFAAPLGGFIIPFPLFAKC